MPASARPTVVDMSPDTKNEVSQLRGNRFAVLGESQEAREIGNRRRLLLISSSQTTFVIVNANGIRTPSPWGGRGGGRRGEGIRCGSQRGR